MPNIFVTLDDLGRHVETLRNQLGGLKALIGKDGPFPMARHSGVSARRRGRKPGRKAGRNPGRRPSKRAAVKAARKAVSAKVRALRKLQGRYMGLVRGLSAAQKARVKKVKQEKGYGPALKLAAGMKK